MKVAVVFDSAGTIMRTIRSVKCVENGKIMPENSEPVALAKEDRDRVLVLLRARCTSVLSANPENLLSKYLLCNNISYSISCGNKLNRMDVIAGILYYDDVCRVSDLQDAIQFAHESANRPPNTYVTNLGVIINLRTRLIEFCVAAAGYPFPHVKELISNLHSCGCDTYVASGDRPKKLKEVARHIGIPENHVRGTATPRIKSEMVKNLKEKYDFVMMVGNGENDLRAFIEADAAVLNIQQDGYRSPELLDAADYVVRNICYVERIVKNIYY